MATVKVYEAKHDSDVKEKEEGQDLIASICEGEAGGRIKAAFSRPNISLHSRSEETEREKYKVRIYAIDPDEDGEADEGINEEDHNADEDEDDAVSIGEQAEQEYQAHTEGSHQALKDPKTYYLKSSLRVGVTRREQCRLTYELHGDGPNKVLLIMGLCMSKEIWQYQVRHFCQDPTFQVCVLDNRGHAESHANNFYASTHTLALDCIELLRYLRWTSVHIIGLSMGGMIAQELALLLGESIDVEDPRIISLTLAATHAGGRLALLIPAVCIPNILIWLMSITPAQKTRSLMPMCYSPKYLKANFNTVVAWHMESYRHIYYRTLVSHLFAVLTHYVSHSRLARIKSFGFPILVLTGDQDTMVRPGNSFALAESLGARLHVLEGCGHMLNCERPNTFNRLVLKHIYSAMDYAQLQLIPENHQEQPQHDDDHTKVVARQQHQQQQQPQQQRGVVVKVNKKLAERMTVRSAIGAVVSRLMLPLFFIVSLWLRVLRIVIGRITGRH